MSAAEPATSKVFHDAFTHNDAATNDLLVQSVETGDVDELPRDFRSIDPDSVSPGTNGALSEGNSKEGGETVYFGGFKSDEGKFAATNSKGEMLFYFNGSQNKAIIAHLKEERLVPENVSSFSQLGDRAIGVIENAVDQGVLGVTESGQLEVVKVPEDESGIDAPSSGANRVSETDTHGNVIGEERENDAEVLDADGATTPLAEGGSDKPVEARTGDSGTVASSDASESDSGTASGSQAASGTGTTAAIGGGQNGVSHSGSSIGMATGSYQNDSNSVSANFKADTQTPNGLSETTSPLAESAVEGEEVLTYGGSTIEQNGDKFYINTAGGQALEINEGAQWASGVPKAYGVGLSELKQMASEGRLVELRTPGGSIAVGLSKKQLAMVERATGQQGQAAIQNAYDIGTLGINQSTGAVAVKNTDGSTNLERRWGSQNAQDATDITFKQEDQVGGLVNGEQTNVGSESSAYSATAHYKVIRNADNEPIKVSMNGSDEFIEVNQASLDALGFTQNTPLSEVAKAFGNKTLGVVGNEVRVLKYDVKGGYNNDKRPHPPMTVVGDELSGFDVLNQDGRRTQISQEEISKLKWPNGINAVTVSQAISNNQLQFVDGQWQTSSPTEEAAQVPQAGTMATKYPNCFVARDNQGVFRTESASGQDMMFISEGAKEALGINSATRADEVVEMINEGRLVKDVVTNQWEVGDPT